MADKFLFFATTLLLFSILIFFHFKGIVYYDEGYILNSALRVVHGQIPYRDFDMVYTPLSYIITAGFFKLFGVSIFISRITALIISLFSVFALYKILQLITKNIFLKILAILFFIAWGPAHINFVWPVMFAICLFLYSLYFYLLGVLNKNKKYFFLAGIFTLLILLSKQNFGVGIFCITFFSFIFLDLKSKKYYLAQYLYGLGISAIIYLLILILTSSLVPFLENMYIYTYKRILVQKALDTPFLYSGSFIEKLSKLFLYTSPLLFSFLAILPGRKSKNMFLIIPLSVAMFYLSGIRPTTDYNHLVPLLALSCMPLVLSISYAKKNVIKKIFLTIFILLTILGFYTAYFSGYYKWDYSLREQIFFSDNPRISIYTNKQKTEELQELSRFIQSHTKSDEYIFVNYYAPLIYFISNRRNPSRYDFFSSNELPINYQIDAKEELKKKNVKLVIMHAFNKNENSLVTNYVKKQYSSRKNIGDWIIFTK